MFAALSDQLVTPGLGSGFTAGTPVATTHGWKPIEDLRPDDLLLTADGDPTGIARMSRRDVPAKGSLAPIRLRAPYLGLSRDLFVSPDQTALMRGTEIEYAFGSDQVLVQSRFLPAAGIAQRPTLSGLVRYYQLWADRPAIIGAAGARFEIPCATRGARLPIVRQLSALEATGLPSALAA